MQLPDSVQLLKGVGPRTGLLFKQAGIETIADLIDYWPRKYNDYSNVSCISQMEPGLLTLKGMFSSVKNRRSQRGLHITEALLNDTTGSIKIVWFNQPYRASSLKLGVEYFVHGDYSYKGRSMGIANPSIELAEETNGSTIMPVYRESRGLTSRMIMQAVKSAMTHDIFSNIQETLPSWLVKQEMLLSRSEAIRELHVPKSSELLKKARARLAFEEVFQMQLAGELTRRELATEHSPPISFQEDIAKVFVKNLAFKLTDDQKRSVWQIYKDMSKSLPMNRLIEGDVGSGKTVVAAMASAMAMASGFQVLCMAPTEILARQHAENLKKLLSHTRWSDRIGLLVGGLTKKEKDAMHARIKDGECLLAVGTNALIQDKVVTQNVGLVIIDEQHRFGVEQRTKLRTKAGLYPHVLCMTATPIPRTLALTLYGELAITQLKTMPSGRAPVETEIVKPGERHKLYKRVGEFLKTGRQVFMVCPLIDPNPSLGLTSATELYESLKATHFKNYRLGLLHGGMKPAQKDEVMLAFKNAEIDLLVTTTVIEVGVDVPNATVMIVENAERFGLAQVHQLRGRVGRSHHQGYCYLVPTDNDRITRRLRVLTYVKDGFRLSEIDMELRGPGAIYGTRQSGVLDLRIAKLDDEKLILRAKMTAEEFLSRAEDMLKYGELSSRVEHFRSIQKLN